MKILFIDPICLSGHINFNQIHLTALLKEGYDVDCIFKIGYSEKLSLNNATVIFEYGDDTKYSFWGGLQYRYNMLRHLLSIKQTINFNKYDHIIISCYDELALLIANYPKSYIIDHNNISNLNSFIKKIAFRKISQRHIHIALSDSMKNKITEWGFSVRKVSHGLIEPYDSQQNLNIRGKYRYVIFSPSAISSDKDLNQSILYSEKIHNWLKRNNALFIIKGNYDSPNNNHIKIIRERISDDDYRTIFQQSDCILINYPTSFKFRASGVLFESFANKKRIVIRDNPNFKEYESYLGPMAFFNNIDELINSLDFTKGKEPQYDFSKLNADYSFLKTDTH